jgi:hypothetical protein
MHPFASLCHSLDAIGLYFFERLCVVARLPCERYRGCLPGDHPRDWICLHHRAERFPRHQKSRRRDDEQRKDRPKTGMRYKTKRRECTKGLIYS